MWLCADLIYNYTIEWHQSINYYDVTDCAMTTTWQSESLTSRVTVISLTSKITYPEVHGGSPVEEKQVGQRADRPNFRPLD